MAGSAAVPGSGEASSWAEFNAQLEAELAGRSSRESMLGWASAGFLFADALIATGYAFTYGYWWTWPLMLGSLVVLGWMAVRAVDRADKYREHDAAVAALREAWFEEHG